LSIGLFAFGSSLRITVLDHNTTAARGAVGADVRFLVPFPDSGVGAAAALPAATTLVFKGPVIRATDPRYAFSTVVGVDPSTYAAGGWWPPKDAATPLPDLLVRLKAHPIGYAVPAGTSSVEIEATAPSPAPKGVHIVIPTTVADGSVRDVDLGALRAGTQIYRGESEGATRLLSVMLAAPPTAPISLVRAGSFAVTFERLTALGTGSDVAAPISGWRGLQTTGLIVRTAPTPSGGLHAEFQVAGGGPIGGIAPTDPPLPAILPAADAAGGSPVDVHMGFAGFSVRPVGALRGFPTVSRGSAPIVVPLVPLVERFHQILQPPNGGSFEVLGMGTADPSAAIRRAGFSIGSVSRAADIESALATSPQNLALGMEFAAGFAGASLAVLALGLALFFGAQRRRYELSSLRALGGKSSHAVIALALEYGLVLVPAAVLGAIEGTALLRLVLTSVAPPVPGAGPVELAIDGTGVALATAAALLTLLVGLVSTGRQMRSRESTSVLRGEPE
jgi:FtsX-like permease family